MNNLFKLIISIVFLFCVSGSLYPVHAASKEKLVKKGNTFFSSGQYDEAISAYDEAAVDDPESPYIYFNKGTALYKKENFSAAKDAFAQAAVKSKDLLLESKSKFNLGLCFFREAERQKDNDLKKTIEAYGQSIQSFQEAIELTPEFEEAAENIEMVRLMMKSVLDEIKKQEEETKKQQEQAQKIAEQIKKQIEQQDDLLKKSQTLLADKPSPSSTDIIAQKNQKIADAQSLLKQETQNLSQELSNQPSLSAAPSPSPSGPPPPPQPQQEHPSKQHLDDSITSQEEAVQKLSESDTQTGAYQQEKSLEALNKALEALKSDQKQQSCDQQQQGEQQQPDQQKQDQQEQKQEDPGQENKDKDSQSQDKGEQDKKSDEDEQQEQAMQLTDNPDSILNEEKENNKQRMPYSSGGFKEVDKDW
jgi:Ca-activated chloride channel family protein